MTKYKVVLDQPGELHPAALECLMSFAAIVVPESFDEDELIGLLQDADALMSWGNTKLTGSLLAKVGKSLKTIAVTGTGVDNIDLAAAKQLGITVTNTPGVNANAVAEYTICAVLCCLRKMFEARSATHEGIWKEAELFTGRELKGSTAGVVGLGNIGRRVAGLLKMFDTRVLGYDPLVTEMQAGEIGVCLERDLAKLCAEADFICVHAPLNEHTRAMLGKQCFEAMRSHVWLINVGRAPVVDEELLVSYLKEERIAGYMTDVYPVEPPDLQKKLYRLDRVCATPHIAAMTDTAYRDMQLYAARNIQAILEGAEPMNIVV